MTNLRSQNNIDIQGKRERTLKRFATLLGTYSLSENKLVISSARERRQRHERENGIKHNPQGQIEKLITALSSSSLHSMIDNSKKCTTSSFPALILKSFGGYSRTDFSSKEQTQNLASFFLGRNLTLVPPDSKKVSSDLLSSSPTTCASKKRPYSDISSEDHSQVRRLNLKRDRSECSESVTQRKELNRTPLPPPQCTEDDTIQTVDDISKVPFQIMSNFSSSFALLVESRIHAYGNSLKRNIGKLSNCPNDNNGYYDAVKRLASIKLKSLDAIAEHIEVRGVVTAFNVNEEKFESQISQMVKGSNTASSEEWFCDKDITVITLPFSFEAIVDTAIPSYCGEPESNEGCRWKNEKFSVTMQTSGTIMGYYEGESNSILEKVDVQLNSNTLISEMIRKSGEVLKKTCINANVAISKLSNQRCERTNTNERDYSSLNRQPSSQSTGAGLNSCEMHFKNSIPTRTTSRHVKMVTPDLKPAHCPITVPCLFTLDAKSIEQTASPTPSIISGNDDCAAIVDYAIGDFNATSTTSSHYIPNL